MTWDTRVDNMEIDRGRLASWHDFCRIEKSRSYILYIPFSEVP